MVIALWCLDLQGTQCATCNKILEQICILRLIGVCMLARASLPGFRNLKIYSVQIHFRTRRVVDVENVNTGGSLSGASVCPSARFFGLCMVGALCVLNSMLLPSVKQSEDNLKRVMHSESCLGYFPRT
jgi:hypothetical protein